MKWSSETSVELIEFGCFVCVYVCVCVCVCVDVSVCNVRTCGNNFESFNVGAVCSEEMGFPIICPSEAVFIVCLSSSELFSSCYSRVHTF